MLDTPILFLIFNRPDSTAIVFDKIKQQKPKKLYVAADGPRKGREQESEKCEETKQLILKNIDWDCQVQTLFRSENLGCGKAVSQAISWFFEFEEEGIILEDDCVPSDSFFFFCTNMLSRYRDDEKIMHITGTNLNDSHVTGNATYHFSNYPNIWGWATWRRAWKKYDFELKDTSFYNKLIKRTFHDPFERDFWRMCLNSLPKLDTWDYQWMFSIWKQQGICVNTNFNFIANIGFNDDATHTKNESPHQNLPVRSIQQLVHPSSIVIDEEDDIAFIKTVHGITRKGNFKFFMANMRGMLSKFKLLLFPKRK